MGPTHIAPELPGIAGTETIHVNTADVIYRDGEPPPDHLKWYTGQGGLTGHQSGTPFATADPRSTRPPDEPPPVDWDPETSADLDIVSDTAREADASSKPRTSS